MIWIEMSKDKVHGGGEWGFAKCLWSPAYKLVNGKKRRWAYWELLLLVKAGDIVVHLRGDKIPKFIGHSIAASDGFSTTKRPPNPGENWNYADTFYKVNLKNYETFDSPIELDHLFIEKSYELRSYFKKNKNRRKKDKKLLFYVIQNSDLRRQNGAYLSEVDNELYKLLFDVDTKTVSESNKVNKYAATSECNSKLTSRVGQSNFSENVRNNFNHVCCFPGCEVKDRNFLVGAHITRWSNFPEYRGETSNGLCLCLLHDKAFEIGLFTIDENYCVSVNRELLRKFHTPVKDIAKFNGERIKKSNIPINIKFLKHHWSRIGYKP